MEPPPVRYVTTSGGIHIAFTDSGDGVPLVMLPIQFNHVQLAWRLPASGGWLSALAQRFRLVTYDARCQGLSTRGCPAADWVEGDVEDLSAVVNALKLDQFVLFAVVGRCHTAIHYAVRHPDRVHALVLQGPLTSAIKGLNVSAATLAQRDWEFFLSAQVPEVPPEESDLILGYLRAAMTQADWLDCIRNFAASRVDDVLDQVRTPTLVTCPVSHYVNEEDSRAVAARILSARLVVLDGRAGYPGYLPDPTLAAIDSFLGELAPSSPPANASARKLSPREVEVIRLVAEGKTNREIARYLVISERTVINHLSNIFTKTGAENRAAAAAFALRHGLIG